MKKRIFTLSVVSLLALVATGCSSDVKAKVNANDEDVIVTIKRDGEEITYTADDLFNDYLSTSAGASAAFSAVYDVLISTGVEGTQEMENSVNNSIADLQNNAKTNAATNGTSYKEEESNLLESAGAEDLDEYKSIQELNWKKNKFENNFYDQQMYDKKMNNETVDTSNGQYALSKEFIENENPYHVRHILIKTSSSGSSFLPEAETLSESEAIKLGNTIKNLASDSSTFGQVALDFSEDGSSENFGSLNELMGRSTSYVNEFKFAVFQYDAYLNKDVKDGSTSLDIPEKVDGVEETTENVLKNSMKLIPFSIADALIDNANITTLKDKENKGEDYKYDGKEKYYPRNYLFNQYFSNHGLNFIFRGKSGNTSRHFRSNEQVNTLFADFFTANSYTGDERDILCDEKGNPILVTRAGTGSGDSGYQGIHFIVIENSPLINENKATNGVYPSDYVYSSAEELKYYSVNVPKNSDDVTQDKRYVTFVDATQSDYDTRADEIKNAVKSYDSNVNFRLYEKIYDQLKASDKYAIKIKDEIEASINEYISSTRNKTQRSKETTYKDSWKTYIRQLVTQAQFANYKIDESIIIENFDVKESFNNIK